MTRERTVDLHSLGDAQAATLLFAADPHGFGGIVIRGRPGPAREQWLGRLKALATSAPWRRLPPGTDEGRLDGGLDLAAALAGRLALDQGLLAASDGGLIVVPTAEQLPGPVAARLGAALDTGLTPRGMPARFGLVALDEGSDDERVPAGLADRLAFWIDGEALDAAPWPAATGLLAEARKRAEAATAGEALLPTLAGAAAALGIASLRPPILALRAARLTAALAGRDEVAPEDVALAARLILAPRATQWPGPPEPEAAPDGAADHRAGAGRDEDPLQPSASPEDVVMQAVKSGLPPGLLLGLQTDGSVKRRTSEGAGAAQVARRRGRPAGTRRGMPREGARLNLVETLRAAAPWQTMRRDEAPAGAPRVLVRRDDLRLTRLKQRRQVVTLFAVDASGSLALQRLTEAKGAVELLLAECYVRRDEVALLAFRGKGTDLLLPPTRSLTRAKRCLANLAGGGATPLPAALEAVQAFAETVRRRGRSLVVVLFTDGHANVARDGAVDRARAAAEAHATARRIAQAGLQILLIDAAPRPQLRARDLARALAATYVPLPRADAATLTAAVRRVAAE